jgi:VIT1/CCC1 family predicted Fe2+/Mn2+ transporter
MPEKNWAKVGYFSGKSIFPKFLPMLGLTNLAAVFGYVL